MDFQSFLEIITDDVFSVDFSKKNIRDIKILASKFGINSICNKKKNQLIEDINLVILEYKSKYEIKTGEKEKCLYISHSTLGQPVIEYDVSSLQYVDEKIIRKSCRNILISEEINPDTEKVKYSYHYENIASCYFKIFLHDYKTNKNIYFNKNFFVFQDESWIILDDISFIDDVFDMITQMIQEIEIDKLHFDVIQDKIENDVKLTIQIKKSLLSFIKKTLKIYYC